PAAILLTMFDLLKPGGVLVASFGPTWYHPLGGHLVSVFPWAHLIFSENALMRWRSSIRSDGAKRFHEVEGAQSDDNQALRAACQGQSFYGGTDRANADSQAALAAWPLERGVDHRHSAGEIA